MTAAMKVTAEATHETLVERHGIRVITENTVGFCAKAWRGKAKKPYAYFSFPTEARRTTWVEGELEAAEIRAAAKALKVKTNAVNAGKAREKFTVGTVIVNTWGYDQTNVDFYEVVRRSATGATVWVREIGEKVVEGSGGFMCESVTPVPGTYLGGEIKKVVVPHGVQFSFGWTDIVENLEEPHYKSWYA